MNFLLLICITLVSSIGSVSVNSRSFINPFNKDTVDLCVLVYENPTFLSQRDFISMKSIISDTADRLSPAGSSPRFIVGFYGATTQTRWAIPTWISNSNLVRQSLNLLPYSGQSQTQDMLPDALTEVENKWTTLSRPDTPRILVVIAPQIDSNLETTFRKLERSLTLTVIVVAVGSGFSQWSLDAIASAPNQIFGIPFPSIDTLYFLPAQLVAAISEVGRPVNPDVTIDFPTTQVGSYNTMTIPLHEVTDLNDAIVVLNLVCTDCTVFGSTTDPRPTDLKTSPQTRSHESPSLANSGVYYFHIKKDTSRLFVTVQVKDATVPIQARLYRFPVPPFLN